MNNHPKLSRTGIGILVVVALLAGCVETRVKTEQPGSMADINTVLVLDFYDVTADHGDSGMIKCPLCGNYFEAGQVPPETADRLTETAVEMMSRRTNISMFVNNRTANQETDGTSERRFITRTGQAAGADAVLTGYIYRYIAFKQLTESVIAPTLLLKARLLSV